VVVGFSLRSWSDLADHGNIVNNILEILHYKSLQCPSDAGCNIVIMLTNKNGVSGF